jgi:hypothetical protein
VPASAREQRQVAQRRAQAIGMRAAGATYQQIADELGHKTAAAAAQDVTRGLQDQQAEAGGQGGLLVTLEAERLDAAERRVQAAIEAAVGEADHELVLRGVDRLLRISRQRAALLRLAVQPGQGGEAETETDDTIENLAAYRARRRAKAAAARAKG